MSSFAANHVQSIITASQSVVPNDERRGSYANQTQSPVTDRLYSLLTSLRDPLDHEAICRTIEKLPEDSVLEVQSREGNEEQNLLQKQLEERLLVGLYARSLDVCLEEATEADSEADWWSNVQRSWVSVALYLLATLPLRLKRALGAVIQELRVRNMPLSLSSFTPRTLRQLFPPSLHPTALSTAFFPHLKEQAHLLFSSPIELARLECRQQRHKLLELRNNRAQELGELLSLKRELENAVKTHSRTEQVSVKLQSIVMNGSRDASTPSFGTIPVLKALSGNNIQAHISAYNAEFTSLRRPSRLTLLWPRLALLPPAALVLFRILYGSRDSIANYYSQGIDTLHGFWTGYVIGPMKDILNTVRTGGDDGMRIVSQEGVRADLESLERMAIALSKDKLSYNDTQLAALADQVRQGDLTPVLKVYEEDIKSPLRSAISGTLVRSLLIQVQKAKVDLDQALSGIDKLLKSQELTFAFVGVAPSLAILYGSVSYARGLWSGGRGSKRFGGHRREVTWQAIRRIERLLINSERKNTDQAVDPGTLSPLTSGLLLISISQLRSFAEKNLPKNSRIREGFLEDVSDLEDPELGREEKQKVVERMWRSWGDSLCWGTIGKHIK